MRTGRVGSGCSGRETSYKEGRWNAVARWVGDFKFGVLVICSVDHNGPLLANNYSILG